MLPIPKGVIVTSCELTCRRDLATSSQWSVERIREAIQLDPVAPEVESLEGDDSLGRLLHEFHLPVPPARTK